MLKVSEYQKIYPTVEEIEQAILDLGSDHLPTFGGNFEGGINGQQVSDELAPCISDILESGEEIKSYLEIGSASGGSCFIINKYFHLEKIVLIDDNIHPKAVLRPVVLNNILRIELIGSSHDNTICTKIREMNTSFDMLLIDGDHLYEGCRQDLEMYGPVLKENGWLILHDTQIGQPFGTNKLFNELLVDSRWKFVKEYVSEKYSKCGIGLFRKVR